MQVNNCTQLTCSVLIVGAIVIFGCAMLSSATINFLSHNNIDFLSNNTILSDTYIDNSVTYQNTDADVAVANAQATKTGFEVIGRVLGLGLLALSLLCGVIILANTVANS